MELYEEVANALLNANRRNSARTKPEDVRSAVVALRSSQFVFESRSPGQFAILKSLRTALEPHFELSGCQMLVDDAEGYVALVPMEEVSRFALTVEETLILLTLRWIYETKVEIREIEGDGSVRMDEPEIQQWYERTTGRSWPKKTVVRSSIDMFERRGILTSGMDDLDNRIVFVRGVVRLVTGSGWTGRLRSFLEGVQLEESAKPEGPGETAPDGDGATDEGVTS